MVINYLDVVEQLLPTSIEDIKEAVDLVNEVWIKYNFNIMSFWSYTEHIEDVINIHFKALLNWYWLKWFVNIKWNLDVQEINKQIKEKLSEEQQLELADNKIFQYYQKRIPLELTI